LTVGGFLNAVRWWTVPLYFVVLTVQTWFRSVRWRFLLRSIAEVPKKRLLSASLVGFGAILLLPFRIGEIVRPYLIRTPRADRTGGKAITLTAATSSVVAERIIDGLYLSIVLALALVFVPTVWPLPRTVVGIPISVEQVRLSGYVMLAGFAGLFATIAVFYFARSWADATTMALVGKVSPRLAERVASLFEKAADGLHIFGRVGDAAAFLGETTLYWGVNVLGLWMLAWGSGVVHADGTAATLGEACAIMGMLGCAVMIPGPPGLLGVFQAGVYAAMTMYYPTAVVTGAGAAFVFLLYATQVGFTVVAGFVGVVLVGGERGLRGLDV
jgi:hypothetical protein